MQQPKPDSDFPKSQIAAAAALQVGDTVRVIIDGGERSHRWLPQSPTARVVSTELSEVYPTQPDRTAKQFESKLRCVDAVDAPKTTPHDADFRIVVRERRGQWYAIELYAPIEPDRFTRVTRNSISAFNDDEDIGSILDLTVENTDKQEPQPPQHSPTVPGEYQQDDSRIRTTSCRRCGKDAEKFDQIPVENIDDDCLGKFCCPDGHITVR